MSADCVKFVVCLLLLPSVVECCFGGRKKKAKQISKYAYYLYNYIGLLVCERIVSPKNRSVSRLGVRNM